MDTCFIIIKPTVNLVKVLAATLTLLDQSNLQITRMSIRQKNEYWYRLMYAHVPSEVFKNMEAYLLGDHLIGIQVWGENAVAACKNIKHLIRSQFADTNITYRNVIHTSDSPDTAYWEANYFFAGGLDAQQN